MQSGVHHSERVQPGQGPKGKLPYITDGANTVADSTFILDYLKATYGDQLDAGLDLHRVPRRTRYAG